MKNLLITSPEGYARRLTQAFGELDKEGMFHPVSVPMIRTDIHIASEEFEKFIGAIGSYDYVAFASRKAVEALAAYVDTHDMAPPASLKLCAIGKDNEALKELLRAVPAFVAKEPSPMGIVHTLAGLEDIGGKRIAVLAPQVVGMEEPNIVPDFVAALKGIGMRVDRVTAYQTAAADGEALERTCEMIVQHKLDGIVFTSGTEIKVFLRMVPQGMDANTFLKDVNIICYGPYTASYAQKLGIRVDFTSPQFGSFGQLVANIRDFYTKP